MKKLIMMMTVLSMALVLTCGCAVSETYKAVKEVESEEVAYSSDKYEVNTYEITEVNGDEINGVAVDNITEENGGIVMSKEYDNVDFVVGDVVTVVFEKGVYDVFVDVTKN